MLHTAGEDPLLRSLEASDEAKLRQRGLQSREIRRSHKPMSNTLCLGIGIGIGTAIGSSVTLLLLLLLVAK